MTSRIRRLGKDLEMKTRKLPRLAQMFPKPVDADPGCGYSLHEISNRVIDWSISKFVDSCLFAPNYVFCFFHMNVSVRGIIVGADRGSGWRSLFFIYRCMHIPIFFPFSFKPVLETVTKPTLSIIKKQNTLTPWDIRSVCRFAVHAPMYS